MAARAMLTVLCGALVLAAAGLARAQPAVRGVVVDRATRAPIPGAVIAVDDAAAMSDADGRFALPVEQPAVTLVVSAPAYRTETVRVGEVDAGGEVTLALVPAEGAGEIIEISGEAPSEARAAEATTYEVTPADIRRIAGSGNDALRALQSLPGVGRVPFGLGGLVVRGLGPRSTNVYLDGIEVPQLFHFGGVSSFYPTALLEEVRMEPGGFGVDHGGALAGVVSLRSRRVRGDELRVGSELGLLDLSLRGEGPGPGGSAVLVSLRRSYVDQVLPLFTSEEELGLTLAPRYYDGQLRVDLPRPDNESLSLVVFGADDRAGLEVGAVDDSGFAEESFTYEARFVRLGVPWRRRDGEVAYSVVPYLGIEEFALDTEFQRVRREGTLIGARAQVERSHEHVDVRAGAELRGIYTDLTAVTIYRSGSVELARDGWHADGALWTELLVRLAGGRVLAKPGVRVDYFGQAEQAALDPRLNVSHLFGHGITLRESIGVYHEPPVPADQLWGNDLEPSYAVQGTVGIDVDLGAVDLGVTGFYTELYQLAADTSSEPTNDFSNVNPWEGGAISSSREFISEQFGTFSEQASVGRGRAFGTEVMLRHASPRALAWIAYTLSQSERRDQRHDFANQMPYILDQTHVLTAVASWSLGRWYLGARARYATGNPYTPVTGLRFGRDEIEPDFGAPLSMRLPAYFQVDARVDRSWRRHWGTIRAYLEVTNVTNRLNPEGIVWNENFSESQYTRGLPILPAFGVEYAPAD